MIQAVLMFSGSNILKSIDKPAEYLAGINIKMNHWYKEFA